MRLNTIPLVNFKPETVTRLDIILLYGQVMHIPNRKKYTCHEFDPPVLVPESELVCPAKFMTPMRKTSYWYHDPDEAIHVMVKLKQVVVPYIELVQDNNTTNNLPSRFKEYADMNPHLLSEHYHKIILDKIEARENLNHDEYV